MGFLDADNALQIIRGASKTFTLTVQDSDTEAPVDLTGARIVLSVKGLDTDATPKIVKDTQLGATSIEVVGNPLAGVAAIHFVPGDTWGLAPGEYPFDCWVILADTRRVPVIPQSTLTIQDSITRIPQ
jgi:hypothetical protein